MLAVVYCDYTRFECLRESLFKASVHASSGFSPHSCWVLFTQWKLTLLKAFLLFKEIVILNLNMSKPRKDGIKEHTASLKCYFCVQEQSHVTRYKTAAVYFKLTANVGKCLFTCFSGSLSCNSRTKELVRTCFLFSITLAYLSCHWLRSMIVCVFPSLALCAVQCFCGPSWCFSRWTAWSLPVPLTRLSQLISLTLPRFSSFRLTTLVCARTFTSRALWLAHRRSTLGCGRITSALTPRRTWTPGWGPWTTQRWCRTRRTHSSGNRA